jgi:hypothetical protein
MTELKKRKLMIVIEDDGDQMFQFGLFGDVERLDTPGIKFSAAEYWGVEFMKACQARLNQGGVKRLNREEKRAQK